jgi:hypothetical protein
VLTGYTEIKKGIPKFRMPFHFSYLKLAATLPVASLAFSCPLPFSAAALVSAAAAEAAAPAWTLPVEAYVAVAARPEVALPDAQREDSGA